MGKPTKLNTRRLFTTISNAAHEHPTRHQVLKPPHCNYIYMPEINSQLKQLAKSGRLNEARNMFDKMPQRDVVSWTNIISAYISAWNSSEALLLFKKMWVLSKIEIEMDPFVLSLAFKACALNLNSYMGECLHGYCVKSDFVGSVFVGSALLDMYTKTGKVDDGKRVFDEMPVRNVVSWTAIITGLVRGGFYREGLCYLSDMWRSKEVVCDSYTFAIGLKACADSSWFNYGREIHTQIVKSGFGETSFVVNTLATMYNKCGKLNCGLRLFERMSSPDVVSWTSIITMYVQMGREGSAIEAFRKMRKSDVSPNDYTFAAVISGCANLGKIEWGLQLHGHVMRLGLVDFLSVTNSIMTMYSKCGQLVSTSLIFNGMTRKDVVSWSTVIAGFSQGGFGDEAFEFLSKMRREGPKPNEFALASVLSVCGSMAILDQGKQLHAYVIHIGLEHTAMVQSALINMYSKCGSIMEASNIFRSAKCDDIVSWTAMINGYAEHGHSQEAIGLFERIPKIGLKPDPVTYIGVLAACSHAGQIDLGFRYFNSMSERYGINPSKEHYGCMIDLLCRAGRLKEAENMIRSMPFQRDDVVWSTLLRACRVHGDVDCGRRAAEKVLELDPNCAGTHITLANIYASKGKYKDAADMRKLMRSKGVVKEPGWSWMKVRDEVFAFVAGDRSHPQVEEIYSVLDLLNSRADVSIQETPPPLDDGENLLYDHVISLQI